VEEGLSSFFLKSHGSKSRIVVCGANARATLSEPAFEICLDLSNSSISEIHHEHNWIIN
jgi:hypothetical protein